MKRFALFSLLLVIFYQFSYAQTLTIHKKDSTTVNFQITEIDKISFSLQDTIPGDSLVAYYPFAGNANDQSGNGNHCVLYGNTVLTENRFDVTQSAYGFDGLNSYMLAPYASTLFPDKFTFSVWVKFSTFPAIGDWFMIIRAGNADNSPTGDGWKGYELWLHNGSLTYNDFTGTSFNGASLTYSQTNLDTINWHHIAIVRDLNSKKMYVNGNIVSSTNSATPYAKPQTAPLLLGRNEFLRQDFFHGYLDDIRIYSRVLTDAEVQALVNEE